MRKYLIVLMAISFLSVEAHAKDKKSESFSDPEANFKLVVQKLLDKYLDKNITKEDLYRAATAGMLSSLNSGEEAWNKLLAPEEYKELQADLSGKFTGIGVAVKFDEHSGYGQVLKAIAGSPAEKAGLKAEDQILSVDGKKFKGKHLLDLVKAIRGEVGKKVELKVLREDRIISLNIGRENLPWSPVNMEFIGKSVALLSIEGTNDKTPELVEDSLKTMNARGVKKLIVDIRDNVGGGLDAAVKVAECFLPADSVIASTRNRGGEVVKYRSHKNILSDDVEIILLTNKGTSSGAELLVAALKENKKVKVVGETTFGKWNAQSVETLPNNFAFKFTVEEFHSPEGNNFQGLGIKPDLEVNLPKDADLREMRTKFDATKRLSLDPQLKAALELIKST